MKRLLTIVAAIACMLSATTFTAQATDLSDGAIIKIGTAQLTHEDVDDWSPSGLASGTLIYDEETHTLTLYEATITEQLYIDASANGGFSVTLKVDNGESIVYATDENVIHFANGVGLIIEGSGFAHLKVYAYGSAAQTNAILCAKDQTYNDAFDLTIRGGLDVVASNEYTSGAKFTVYCKHVTIDRSYLYTYNKQSGDISSFETECSWFENDFIGVDYWFYDYRYTRTYFFPYTKMYPIWVDDEQLSDGASEIDGGWLRAIKSGEISYDPDTRTLTLSHLEYEATTCMYAIQIKDDGTGQPITIKIDNPGNKTKLTNKRASSTCCVLYCIGSTLLDLNGCDLDIISDYGRGIDISDNLMIYNSLGKEYLYHPSYAEKAVLTIDAAEYGLFAYLGDASQLNIYRANVNVKGGSGSVKVKTNDVAVALDATHHWNDDHDQVLNSSDNIATDWVKFSLSQWFATGKPQIEGTGSVKFEIDGSDVTNPYVFTEDKTLIMKAEPIENWHFIRWTDNVNSYNPQRTVDLKPADGSREYVARFGINPQTTRMWYATYFDSYYSEYHVNKYEDKFSGMYTSCGALPVTSGYEVKCSTFADGYYYFIEQPTMEDKINMLKAPFDGENLGSFVKVVEDNTDFIDFDDIVYNYEDECFYGSCTRTSDYTSAWVRIGLDGAITEICDIPVGYAVIAMAYGNNGTLYAAMNFVGYEQLCTIEWEGDVMTIGTIGDLDGMYITGTAYTAMCYDSETDELFLFDAEDVWRVNTADASILPVDVKDCQIVSVFSTVPPTPMYTITTAVAAGQDTWGKATLPGGVTSAKIAENSTVILTAEAAEGYKFVKWNDDVTDAIRTITVTEDKTYTASFEEDPDFEFYDVFIGDVQFTSSKLTMTKDNNTYIKNEGTIVFDPTTNTLSLNAVELQTSVGCIRAGANEALDLDIIVNGDCKLTSNPMFNGILIYGKKLVTFQAGMDNPKLSVSDQVAISDADLEIIGLTSVFQGTDYSLVGWSNNSLIITGANVTAKGAADATISNWESVEYRYCSVLPTDIIEEEGMLHINSDDHVASKSTDAPCKSDIYFTPLPKLTVNPFQEGTASFKLESGNEVFPDGVGYFAPGAKVTITPEPSSDFKFGRWLDDANWTDKDLKIPAKREFDMPAVDTDLEALFYFTPESDADWYGINGDAFVKFSFNDHAEKEARATNSLTNIKAGEWFDDTWVFVSDEDVKKIPFSGTLKDGEDIKGDIKDYNEKTISGVTDMAFDLTSEELYAAAGSKLYKITTKENKEVATFKLDEVETPVVAIAFDADGNLFALGVGDGTEGVLYTASVGKDVATLKIVGKKENGGKIGIKVNNAPQSLVFDVQTGELFWGAPDYLRIINTDKMKTYIVGDLGQKAGMQGYIQSLHRMVELVEVSVQVAEDQEDWGIVYLNDDKSTAKNPTVSASFVEGTPVTIKAEANPGYHFDYWVYMDGKKEKSFKGDDKETYDFEASNITYVAYFAEDEEGIESITAPDDTTEKRLVDGTIYILRNGSIYTLTGEKVK